jgi:hypothetical protein
LELAILPARLLFACVLAVVSLVASPFITTEAQKAVGDEAVASCHDLV